MRRKLLGVIALAALALTAFPAVGAEPPATPRAQQSAGDATATTVAQSGSVPLEVSTVMSGLDIPWDVAVIPGGGLLVTERSRRRVLLRLRSGTRVLRDDIGNSWASGESGLMSIEVDPAIRRNRRFYTCQAGFRVNGDRDVRVVAWRLNEAHTSARAVDALVTNIPASSGRHGGCRLEFGQEGALYVGTGDAALTDNPQNLDRLGGKVLRIRSTNGHPWPDNPDVGSSNANRRRVFTHGHRNVQGLAARSDGTMWSVEHGTYRDDEINVLGAGYDYGWQPGPGYDESRPMTDPTLRGPQRAARWSSGQPTVATSGAVWLDDPRWGPWEGRLAVAALKDSSLRIFDFDDDGRLQGIEVPPELNGDFGRLRSVELAPNGALYVTTSNGGGNDRVLQVVPR